MKNTTKMIQIKFNYSQKTKIKMQNNMSLQTAQSPNVSTKINIKI